MASIVSNESTFKNPLLSGTLGDLDGSITITYSGYGAGIGDTDGIDFDEDAGTWVAGSEAILGPSGSGIGLSDGTGTGNLSQNDEGIFIQLSFSGGLNPSDVLLTGWNLATNTPSENNTRMVEVTFGGPGTTGSGNVFGGVVSDASISLTSISLRRQ